MPQEPVVSLKDVLSNIVAYFPSLLAGIVVVLIGIVVSWIVGKLVIRLLIVLRLDRIAQRLGWGGDALAKGDVRHVLFDLVGIVVGGFIFLIFLDNAITIWRLTVLSSLLDGLVRLIPNLVVASLVFSIGWGVASSVARSVRHALYQEGLERPGLVARVVRAAILVLATAIALVQLKLAEKIVSDAFLIAFGAVALSFVLAFGLGSRRAVEKMWQERFSRRRDQDQEKGQPVRSPQS